ncbi:hypothetical protein CX954_08570 [Campylobacter coli]|nr:hypothetical protein [Campylobacter coli]EAJ3369809.1 hypothetical protein [Campylobacter coli]
MKLQDFDFRIWNKDEKCFLDPYTKSRAVVKNLPNEKLLNLEIELFTGLCDKNGNKIYEGDIAKIITFSYDFVRHVAYDKEETRFKLIDNKYMEDFANYEDWDSIEVIWQYPRKQGVVKDLII